MTVLPYCRVAGCTTRAVVVWEAGDNRKWADPPSRAAGACANPRHSVRVQTWVSQAGPIRVTQGDPATTWPDPDQAQLPLDLDGSDAA